VYDWSSAQREWIVRRWGTFRSALAASERSIAGTNAGKILTGVRDTDFYLKHAHPVNHRNELVGFCS
jgi:hypothetical protein